MTDKNAWRASAAATVIVLAASAAMTEPARAPPSFAQQTGQPCSACHTDFPGLTPCGLFKLQGYTASGGPVPHDAVLHRDRSWRGQGLGAADFDDVADDSDRQLRQQRPRNTCRAIFAFFLLVLFISAPSNDGVATLPTMTPVQNPGSTSINLSHSTLERL
jgi:hypothetical protein